MASKGWVSCLFVGVVGQSRLNSWSKQSANQKMNIMFVCPSCGIEENKFMVQAKCVTKYGQKWMKTGTQIIIKDLLQKIDSLQ